MTRRDKLVSALNTLCKVAVVVAFIVGLVCVWAHLIFSGDAVEDRIVAYFLDTLKKGFIGSGVVAASVIVFRGVIASTKLK